MTDTFASGFAAPGIHPVLINPLPIRALKRLSFRSRRKKQHQQTPGATKKVNFTLFEIAGLLVGFDHVARIIHRKRESRHHVNGCETFALLTAFGSAYHSAPRLSLRGSTS